MVTEDQMYLMFKTLFGPVKYPAWELSRNHEQSPRRWRDSPRTSGSRPTGCSKARHGLKFRQDYPDLPSHFRTSLKSRNQHRRAEARPDATRGWSSPAGWSRGSFGWLLELKDVQVRLHGNRGGCILWTLDGVAASGFVCWRRLRWRWQLHVVREVVGEMERRGSRWRRLHRWHLFRWRRQRWCLIQGHFQRQPQTWKRLNLVKDKGYGLVLLYQKWGYRLLFATATDRKMNSNILMLDLRWRINLHAKVITIRI